MTMTMTDYDAVERCAEHHYLDPAITITDLRGLLRGECACGASLDVDFRSGEGVIRCDESAALIGRVWA